MLRQTLELPRPPEPLPPPAAPAADTTEPSGEGWWNWLKLTLRNGGPGQCIFAINNACNAGCDFCNFGLDVLPHTDWRFVPVDEARRAIDVLSGLFIRYLIVSGGEPTLHRDLAAIVRHARRRQMAVLLVTNGSRLTRMRCRELAAAGVSSMVISVDAATAEAHEGNRRLPRLCQRIREANDELRALGVQTTASVTVSRLIDDYDALADFLRQLGFPAVTFSYPLTGLGSSFLGYRNTSLVSFSPQELDAHFESIKKLKGSFPVVNPMAGIEEMQRFLRGDAQRFECLGGYRYFYLDWKLMVWRCHTWDQPMGSIFELDESRYVRDGCTKCMVDCYRDASVMQHVAVSASDALRDARAGRWRSAVSHLAKRSNVESIGATIETRRWIKGL